jgi:hypothetical protein
MKYAWLVIAVFASRFLTTAITYPPGDGDLYWQRLLGLQVLRTHAVPRSLGPEAFSAPYAPWVPQEWLFGIAAYLGRSGIGWDVFAGACALAPVAAIAIACWHAQRRGASEIAVAVGATCGGLAMLESFGVRAQVAVWPLLALFMLALDEDGPWAYAAIPIAAFWSNWHASAVLAPIVAGMVAVGSAFDEGRSAKRTQRLAIIAAACCLAICCNPFGWDLPRYAIGLFDNPIKAYITEWKVTDIDDASFVQGALPLLLLAIAFGGRQSLLRPENDHRWRDLIVLGTFGFLLLSAARNVAVFAIVAIPIVTPALSLWLRKKPEAELTKADRVAAWALPAGAFALAIFVGIHLAQISPPATGLANAPLAALAKMPGDHDVFCADFAWCSLALGVPHERVFLDGRADPFPRPVWEDFIKILRLNHAWRSLLDSHGINTVVTQRYTPLDQAMALNPGWRLAYSDKDYTLYVRTAPVRSAAL